MKDYIHPKTQQKLDAVKYLNMRYDRVKNIMSNIHKDIIEGLDIELELNPMGPELTEKGKIIRIYERILNISPKGNKSKG